MYVNPFWLGVIFTIGAEILFVIIAAVVLYSSSDDNDKPNKK